MTSQEEQLLESCGDGIPCLVRFNHNKNTVGVRYFNCLGIWTSDIFEWRNWFDHKSPRSYYESRDVGGHKMVYLNKPFVATLEDIFGDFYVPYANGYVRKRSTEEACSFAMSRLGVGQTISDFLEICKVFQHKNYSDYKHNEWIHCEQMSVIRHIGKVGRPMFVRSPGNANKGTFDWIHIEASIVGTEDRMRYIKEHKSEIMKLILEKIEKARAFKKYGVPTNFLALENATLTKSGMLYCVFGLKQMKPIEEREGT